MANRISNSVRRRILKRTCTRPLRVPRSWELEKSCDRPIFVQRHTKDDPAEFPPSPSEGFPCPWGCSGPDGSCGNRPRVRLMFDRQPRVNLSFKHHTIRTFVNDHASMHHSAALNPHSPHKPSQPPHGRTRPREIGITPSPACHASISEFPTSTSRHLHTFPSSHGNPMGTLAPPMHPSISGTSSQPHWCDRTHTAAPTRTV